MKRLLPLFLAVPALVALVAVSPAKAGVVGGINLYWGDCSTGGTVDKVSTCVSNSGANIMVASFTAPADMAQFNGMASVLDLTSDTDPLPAWWNAQPLGCRVGAVTGNFDFTGGPFSCNDVWNGGASGGLDYAYPPSSGSVATAPTTNHGRIRLVCAVPDTRAILADGMEHYVFKVTVGNAKSTGLGSCAGCLNKVCIVFNSLLITQPAGVGDFILTDPIANRQVTWQGAGVDCSTVPVRSRTWGQVKSLYR